MQIALITVLALAATVSANGLVPAVALAASSSSPAPSQRTGSAANLSHTASTADTSRTPQYGPMAPAASAASMASAPLQDPTGPASEVADPSNAMTTGLLGDQARSPASGRGFDPTTSSKLPVTSTTTTTWQNSDGTRTAQQFTRPVHYQKSDGTWADVDNTLSTDATGLVHNVGGPVQLSLGKANATPLARLVLADGTSVGFSLSGAKPVAPTTAGDVASYPGVLANTDLSLQAVSGGVKETLVLRNASAPRTFTIPLLMAGLTASLDNNGAARFKNLSGVDEVMFPPGHMEDAAVGSSGGGATSPGVKYALSMLPTPTLTVTLDPVWLADPSPTCQAGVRHPGATGFHLVGRTRSHDRDQQ